MSDHQPALSFQDFVRQEQTSERPHEWVGGRVYNTAGSTERHDLLAALIYEALAPAARDGNCRPFIHSRLVHIGLTAYYPDVLIVCPSEITPHVLYERDLSIVVEVVSPATRDRDYREKTFAYAAAPSFERYLLVDPTLRRIDVCSKAGEDVAWHRYGSGHVVPGVDLDVDKLYEALDASALTGRPSR